MTDATLGGLRVDGRIGVRLDIRGIEAACHVVIAVELDGEDGARVFRLDNVIFERTKHLFIDREAVDASPILNDAPPCHEATSYETSQVWAGPACVTVKCVKLPPLARAVHTRKTHIPRFAFGMVSKAETAMLDVAIEVSKGFIAAFNAQDHEALADTLNYPHIRLANGRFATIESREAFIERSKAGKAYLVEERWDHTVLESIDAVHVGDDKVHLALTNSRCHADGTIYRRFDTLWIVTLADGHWGIQFRSSYLR